MSVLLYDPDCGFCTAAAHLLARFKPAVRIQAGTPQALRKYHVPADRFAQAIPLVTGHGHTIFGADAIALTLRTCPGRTLATCGWVLLRAPIRPLARHIYTAVARNRGRISRAVLNAESCRL